MTQLLFVVCLSIVIFCIVYDFIRRRRKLNQFIKRANNLDIKLKIADETAAHLREQIDSLKTQLHHTFEDPVTKLLGWKLFEDRLDHHISESERYHLTLAVLYIDIDNFKVINDGLSYEVGDSLLQQVAVRLQSCIRQVDSITRFTKDTFVVMLTQFSKPESVALVAQRILQAIAEPFNVNEHELFITCRIGIALYPVDGANSAELLHGADHALHLAKEKGGNVYQFYQEEMHVKSARELALSSYLSRDTIVNEMMPYYQPIMNVEKNTILCMDTILHWQHPELGLIKSDEIFNLADKQRKSNVIFDWLLRTSCQQFLTWQASGFRPAHLSIPVSINQLENTHFIYHLSQVLQELKFTPSQLILEIKDTNTHISFEVLAKGFNMLAYLGINICISDFGVGYFSLNHLKRLRVDYLKLDKSFVDDIDTNEQAAKLIKSLTALAQNISTQIIIQGVDSESQLKILKLLGCHLLQGNQIAMAMPESEVRAKLNAMAT